MTVYSNEQEPLVSVIIPTYNRPAYLREAIKSAVGQTFRNIEILVSDNCSPENPQAIVESFQDSRIRFWRNETNIGMFANAMNTFKKARGKYVASLNDDDVWNEDFLEKLVTQLEANPDLALAFCDHYTIDSSGAINYVATENCTQRWRRDQLKEGIYQPFCEIGLVNASVPSAVSAVIRRDAVDWGNIPPEVEHKWDLYVTYLCCRTGRGAYYYPERLTCYREHTQSDTAIGGKRDVQAKIRKAKAEIFCWERFMEDDRLQEFKPYFRQKWAQENISLGIGLMRLGEQAAARPYFFRALKQQKLNWRTMTALMLSYTHPTIASRF